MRRHDAAKAAALLLVLWLGACAAAFQPMGPAVSPPALTDAALAAADGARLPLRVWAPNPEKPRAVILALHGFNDYSNAFDGAAQFFAKHGIVTYAYDQRGFGANPDPGVWAGTQTMVADLTSAAALVGARHPGLPLYLLGESMGGAVVTAAMGGPNPPEVAGVILSAPAVWGREVMGVLPRAALWLAFHTVPGWVLTAPKELGVKPSDNIEMLKALGRDPLVIKGSRVDALWGLTDLMGTALARAGAVDAPTLVLYGAKEQVLPPKPVATAMERFDARPNATVAVYAEGWHMLLRDLQAEVVMRDILHWIENPKAPLPSRADRAPRELEADPFW